MPKMNVPDYEITPLKPIAEDVAFLQYCEKLHRKMLLNFCLPTELVCGSPSLTPFADAETDGG